MSKKKRKDSGIKEVGKVAAITGAVGGVAYGLYRLFKSEPCAPGETKCDGYNLYTCSAERKWQLTEESSPTCGWQPPEVWFNDREELGRKDFSILVVTGGWVTDNKEMGRQNFSISIISGGWVKDNEEMGSKDFSITVIPATIDVWKSDNEELGRKNFSIQIT